MSKKQTIATPQVANQKQVETPQVEGNNKTFKRAFHGDGNIINNARGPVRTSILNYEFSKGRIDTPKMRFGELTFENKQQVTAIIRNVVKPVVNDYFNGNGKYQGFTDNDAIEILTKSNNKNFVTVHPEFYNENGSVKPLTTAQISEIKQTAMQQVIDYATDTMMKKVVKH